MTSATCSPQPDQVTLPHWWQGAGEHIGFSFVDSHQTIPQGVYAMQAGWVDLSLAAQ